MDGHTDDNSKPASVEASAFSAVYTLKSRSSLLINEDKAQYSHGNVSRVWRSRSTFRAHLRSSWAWCSWLSLATSCLGTACTTTTPQRPSTTLTIARLTSCASALMTATATTFTRRVSQYGILVTEVPMYTTNTPIAISLSANCCTFARMEIISTRPEYDLFKYPKWTSTHHCKYPCA